MEAGGEDLPYICGSTIRSRPVNDDRSRLKRVLSQCLAAFAANTVMFTTGNLYGFSAVLIDKLYKNDAGIECSSNSISWLGSHLFLTPVGTIVIGMIAQYWGSKRSMMIATLCHGIAWLIFYHATNVSMLLVATGISGFFVAICSSVTYVAEISEPQLRSVILSTTTFSLTFGSLVTVSLGALLHWRIIALVNLVTVVAGFAMLLSVPESPHWLASKGRFREAEQELAWLRGWTNLENVKIELQTMKKAFTDREIASADAFHTSTNKIKNFIERYFDRSLYMPMIALCYMSMIRNLSGSITVKLFGGVIFQIIDAPFKEYLMALIFVFRMSGTITYVCCVRSFGKRKLACFTLAVAGICLLVAAASIIFRKQNQNDTVVTVWVPVILIMITNFVICAGYDPAVNDLNGELFPSEYRNIGSGIGNFSSSIFANATNKSFLFLISLVNLEGVLLLWSLSSLIGAATFCYVIPVTEGKSLIEIENHYRQNLKRNKNSMASSASRKPFLKDLKITTEKL
ncbi:hypothetical protein QAD02_022678 [Eretmocerus hayati]|uniref:Uncharacterized protein n=1 Tax=Eretmocerus hayati TaxID=131215 RepID=A0ACC2PW78_9HYME|nr:hypothetical protein QAD02_022678 [Eretmocerus hayati]